MEPSSSTGESIRSIETYATAANHPMPAILKARRVVLLCGLLGVRRSHDRCTPFIAEQAQYCGILTYFNGKLCKFIKRWGVPNIKLTWFIRYIYYRNLQFLNNVIMNKSKILLPQVKVTHYPILAIMFRPFGFIPCKTLNYLAFQFFDFERTWWLFQKCVVRNKFDVYVFIKPYFLSIRIYCLFVS